MSTPQYPSQQGAIVQQPQTIIVEQPEKEYRSFASRKAVSTGGTQLVLGILAIIFQISATVIGSHLGDAAAGVWAGFFFLVAGVIGLSSKSRKSCCKITFYGIFSFIAFLCAISLLILGALGLKSDHDSKVYTCNWDWWISDKDRDSDDDDHWPDEWWENECGKHSARMAMNAMLILFALIEMVVALYAMVICIQGCCGGKTKGQTALPVTSPAGQQTVVVYPNAPRQYIAYPQAQPLSPPGYDATAPPAYNFYEPGQAPVHSSAPADFNNPMYQVQPRDNIYATLDNAANESKKEAK